MRTTRTRRPLFLLAAFGLVAALAAVAATSPTLAARPPRHRPLLPRRPAKPLPAATTTTVAPDTLPDCPTDALAGATGTTEIEFWYSMTGPLGLEIVKLTDAYNASQDKVKVTLVESSYEGTADNYYLASQDNRPDLVQLPEYQVQAMVDTASTVPVSKCIEASGFDTSAFLPTAMAAYETQGVQWSMPFNLSNPVLFYNKKAFAAAGLDPNVPPTSLDELRAFSQQIVDSGAATYGLSLDTGFDSGGGWYVEQWFCKAEEFYVDGDNGRTSRATQVLYNNATGVELLTYLQDMLNDGLAVNVGDNTQTGYDNLLKLADEQQPAAMTIATSASLGPVLAVLGGQFPQIGPDDVGVGPMPGPGGAPGALIGGASLWPVASGDDVRIGGHLGLHHLPGRCRAAEPVGCRHRLRAGAHRRHRGRPVHDHASPPTLGSPWPTPNWRPRPTRSPPAGPVVGPLREIRSVLATAVAAIFDGADVQADARQRGRASQRPDRRLQLPQRLTQRRSAATEPRPNQPERVLASVRLVG
jgi:sn-glycerol 3-phosphate transport system substrate-binding protein